MGETITPRTSKTDALIKGAASAVELIPGSYRRITGRDLIAGFTNAIANIPDAMANATLAGLNPIHGLYSLVIGTPVAALTTSSKLMTVAVTGSMALIVADTLSAVPADQRAVALISLTLMVGVIQILLGALRAGTLVRFVSNSVMRGFLTGVAVNIVLSQVSDVTGYKSELGNKTMRVVDTVLHPGSISIPTVLVALLTVGIILGVERTRLSTFSFPIALVVTTLVVKFAGAGVALVGDAAEIPSALPKLVLPQLSGLVNYIVPALSVAIVGLIQGAGISKAVPNPGGVYSDINRDFMGQGAGNAAAAFFGGMPVGASLSSTALNVQLGGRHRAANFIIGPIIAVVLLLLAPAVELIPKGGARRDAHRHRRARHRRARDPLGLADERADPHHHAGHLHRDTRHPGAVRRTHRRRAVGRAVHLQLLAGRAGRGAHTRRLKATSSRETRPPSSPTTP